MSIFLETPNMVPNFRGSPMDLYMTVYIMLSLFVFWFLVKAFFAFDLVLYH